MMVTTGDFFFISNLSLLLRLVPLMIPIISNYYFDTTLFLGLIIIFLNADSVIFNRCAIADGDMDDAIGETGDSGFLSGIGGLRMANVLRSLVILIISLS